MPRRGFQLAQAGNGGKRWGECKPYIALFLKPTVLVRLRPNSVTREGRNEL